MSKPRIMIDLGDGSIFPDPRDPYEAEWKLRTAPGDRGAELVAAGVMAAYRELVTTSRQRREFIVRKLRAAMRVPRTGGRTDG